jgi:tRNA (guanine37-N1)-methyltransferase
MEFHILTIFPEYFSSPLATSLLHKAKEAGLIRVSVHDLRRWASGKHRTTDDYPYGGGAGMVMKPEPVVAALEAVSREARGRAWSVLLSPQGWPLTQEKVVELSRKEALILVCGRYEGIDERVRRFVDEEVSIGDYVLSGGEAAALVVVEAVARLVPGVLGSPESLREESFATGLLEYPQYTRPEVFRGLRVPAVLLSGNHQEIARWRREQALLRTKERRPDLLARRAARAADRRRTRGSRRGGGSDQGPIED